MTSSFAATVAFGVLGLFSLLAANLVVLVFTGSRWHVWGCVAAILAAGAAYWAQHLYTSAAISREHGHGLAAGAAEQWGGYCQLAAVIICAAALVCFVLGMQK